MKEEPRPTGHEHIHEPGCGHPALINGHALNYLEDGRLVEVRGGETLERAFEVSDSNPSDCRPIPETFLETHHHGPGCGHPAVPHGNHVDYLVDGRLYHPHGDHCDDHGPVEMLDNE